MTSSDFSALKRHSLLEKMAETPLNILIIGGGITGSGIALDAASRGMRTGLIEKKDFASGTSSKSGKLIHGGLKYLQQLDFAVIRETGRERDVVYRNARHLVRPIRMLFPLMKNESFTLPTLKLGLTVYDQLAGVSEDERHEVLSRRKTLKKEPLLNPGTTKGSGRYVEYRTDDSRLTLEVIKTAAEYGALAANYVTMEELIKDGTGKAVGVKAVDVETGRSYSIYADFIVNAAGPWVDKVRIKDAPVTGKHMVLAKGIHIVFPHERLPVQESIYFQHKGRMIAVIPREGCTYVGSTESLYEKDMEHILVEREEVDYLLSCLHAAFPSLSLSADDIISSWAGVRPLIGEKGRPPAELSRHDDIFYSDSGLVTIAGGKLTGYRKMAERVLSFICEKGNLLTSASRTDAIPLTGGSFGSDFHFESCLQELKASPDAADLPSPAVEEYFYRYGRHADQVIQMIQEAGGHRIKGEAAYTIENESACTLMDFFERRTSLVLFAPDKASSSLEDAAEVFASRLHWDQERTSSEIETVRRFLQESLQFQKEDSQL
ncbi:glycerol-3-phosphate dehydrogenase/oxidase [Sinobaca sp. H24]|uniref:glycerol-3-phosphate dehydrogenase/oxidase n=1 Tax=Sinobaca sp. H24 TaxID=2923376 RepID=UPI00207A101F|nr:glycerol-3-phosphate dehydrogenase/oxidase [Sinobaca sp. H24]